MADRKRQTKKRRGPRPSGKVRKSKGLLYRLLHRPQAEFRPDVEGTRFVKFLHLTEHQRSTILRWTLYVAVCLLALIVQDTIMSRVRIYGSTTDLAVGALIVLSLIEGCETGSVIALVGSILYWFSGSAPGPACVALITLFTMAAALFRQQFWHRSAGSVILCSGMAVIAYELGTCAVGIFNGVTRWDRFGAFFLTGILTCITLIPLYAVLNRVGQIGGNTWNE